MKKKLHFCELKDCDIVEGGRYGIAVSNCWEEEDGKLWVTNEEYSNTVNFCPFCGYKSKVSGIKKRS